ncbi:LpqN/LpqT family lipoprotein [Mycobacterium sp.]|uniref:LpqN/LpqT family lipoprotein n=1 Tax=Mycobacterium sp. TaxID=1785 RepID=UPI0031D409BB
MRFDEFVKEHGFAVLPVDRFAGLVVEVGVPPGWEPFDSALGVRVWVCRNDRCLSEFCANAVLTMHRVQARLDPAAVFAMLADQQLQSVPTSRELRRELAVATEGAGLVGALAMQITHELGAIDSVSQSRIISAAQDTLIAQLTVTALHDSPVDRADVWLTVRPGAAAGAASAGDYRAPVIAPRDGR